VASSTIPHRHRRRTEAHVAPWPSKQVEGHGRDRPLGVSWARPVTGARRIPNGLRVSVVSSGARRDGACGGMASACAGLIGGTSRWSVTQGADGICGISRAQRAGDLRGVVAVLSCKVASFGDRAHWILPRRRVRRCERCANAYCSS
jgi:hypothetical protein